MPLKKIQLIGVVVCFVILPSKLLAQTASDVTGLESNIWNNVTTAGTPTDATISTDIADLESTGAFSDVDYTTATVGTFGALTHINQLHDMVVKWAQATGTYSASNAANHLALQNAIISAYNYWITNNPQDTANWWWADIAVPDSLSESMVVMQKGGILPSANLSAAITMLDHADAVQSTLSASNLMWTAYATVGEGAIEYLGNVGNTTTQASAITLINNSFTNIGKTVVQTTSDGVQYDWSYHAHGPRDEDTGYGVGWAQTAATIASETAGTSFSISTAKVDLIIDYLLNGPQWMTRGNTIDPVTLDRAWSRNGAADSNALGLRTSLSQLISVGDGYRETELQSFLARLNSAASTGTASTTNYLDGNREYWKSDYMVHQRAGFYISVKTNSSRTYTQESINGENLKGLLGDDGLNLIMQSGNEYDDMECLWDWYRLPGTTTERSPTGVGGSYSLSPPTSVKGNNAYAGGASDGTYGATADEQNKLNVAAYKSYFLFDKEEACLGAGISAPNAAATDIVGTNLNQTFMATAVTYSTGTEASGTQSTLSTTSNTTVTPTNLRWVNQGSVGYFFLTPASNVTISTAQTTGTWASINTSQTGSKTNYIFSLDVLNGERPSNASYLYLIVPGIAASAMDAYLASNPVTINSNTTVVQSVTDNSLGLTEASFYGAGSFTAPGDLTLTQVTTGHGSSVLMQATGDTLKLSVANIDQTATSMTFTLNADLSGTGATWNASTHLSTIHLTMPTGNSAGSTVVDDFVNDSIPEPASASLLLLPILAMRRRGRQRRNRHITPASHSLAL
jgi:chondroitin AC lyase